MQDRTLGEALRQIQEGFMNDILEGKVNTERIKCRYCGSETIWKYGKNRSGEQRYKCPQCGKVFLNTDALPKMSVTVRQLGDVIGQYYGGLSYKELRRQFKQQHDTDISRSSFHRWLTKYSKVATDEVSKYTPKVGDTWIADECVLKIGGRKIWCWDIIDSDSRYLLATYLSPTRKTKDAKKLMEKAYKVAGKAPKVIITDALASYLDGIELVFGANTKHIQSKPFAEADLSTNKIERWHSTLRTREGIMRGLKSLPTAQALLDGWLVHYNYFRPHESLDNKTPAEVAGIEFPYKDWLDLIESQRVIINPDNDSELSVEGQLEQYRYPTYGVQKKRKLRKVKRASNKTMKQNTTLKGIRR